MRSKPVASIIIPAHNEERSIGRLLRALDDRAGNARFEIIVVCNGCTDGTEQKVRSVNPETKVVVTDIPSKKYALGLGDRTAGFFPRIFIDADVEIAAADVDRLLEPLQGGFLACAPRRVLPRDGVNRAVGWYYDVWEALPQVQAGLFGRGVIALSESGNSRVRALPQVMSDDLAMSEAFAVSERLIVEDAVVVVRPPKTVADLINRRVRVATGIAEVDQSGLRGDSARTSPRTLLTLVRDKPNLLLRMPVFVAITIISRIKSSRAVRKGDFTTWQRDESSRS